MGIFNKINEKSGVIVTVIVIALALFILGGDLIGPNSFFASSKNVGEIAGQKISIPEYSKSVDEVKAAYARQGRPVGENEMSEVNNQAWSELVFKYAYDDQFEKLGITVTEEEVEEMISGTNLHEGILTAPIFQDSVTKEFSRKMYDQWRNTQQGQQAIESFKQGLSKERIRVKYMNLFQNSFYVTKEEAKREHKAQNTKAEVKYLYVPFYSIPDDSFKVSDDEIEAYIKKHENEFKVEDRRSIEYVVFPVGASAKDTAQIKEELQGLAQEFATTEDDSLFSMSNSDQPSAPSVMKLGELPESLKSRIDVLKVDEVYGPFAENGRLKLYKVLDVIEDPKDTMYYASTKHILFMTREKTPEQKDSIKKKAQEVLSQLQKGADFDEMVLKYSDDPGSKNNGGEYKWFPKGQMVKPFEQAVFGASSPGIVPKLVETEYGYHLLKVTNTKSNKKFKIVSIDKEIAPSEGREKAYQKAINFAEAVKGKDTADFRAAIKKDSLALQKANNFKTNDTYIGGLNNPRELVKWAFNEASEKEVSPVFSVQDQYVVAILTRKRDKGIAEAEDARDEVKPKVIAEKKAAQIIEKLNKTAGDIDKKAQAYGPSASKGVATDVTIASGSIQGIGADPALVGTVFGLVPGKKTVPLKGDNGVAIFELVKITEAPEIADYSGQKTTMIQQKKGALMSDVDKAIREDAEIEDNRIKYF